MVCEKQMTLCGAAWLMAAGLVFGGSLTPPAGPIGPTPGPEPRVAVNSVNTPGDAGSLFRITQPGSYYLTGNITGVAAKHGITIAANGVTLDLRGFDLVGVAGSMIGVLVAGDGVCVREGTIRNWGGDGVNLHTNGSENGVLVDLRAMSNGGNGIMSSVGGVFSRCTSSENGGTGFLASNACSFTGCTALDNAFRGFSAGNGSTVTNCAARANGTDGFFINTGVFSGCAASVNMGNGFDAFNAVFSDCAATSNTLDGFCAGNGSTVRGCTSDSNSGDGIQVGAGCHVSANMCRANGINADGAGIHATGGDNRIEGNNCSLSVRGIDVDLAGNVIIRNTCSGNTTDWVIVANNVVGPIIDRRAPASAAINGFAAPDSTGSTHPNANFSY